jgi:hypothetical protein
MRLENVSPDEIDLQDRRFRISYHFDLQPLLLSIEKIGLVNPPVVVRRGGKRFILVSGWKRIAACLELSLLHLPVFVLDEKDDFRAFLVSLYDNLTTRKFDLLEKAQILSLLCGFVEDEKKIAGLFLPLLEIPPTLSCLDIYLRIARLSPRWKDAIFKKKIPLSCVELLLEFSPREKNQLFPLLEPLNANKQKQILGDLYDLSRKIEKSPQNIMEGPEVQSILKNKNLSPLQKAEQVRSLIEKRRYPFLSEREESFKARLKKAGLSSKASYNPVSLFEDGEFSIAFDLKSRDSFQKRIAGLRELISDDDLFRLFGDFSDG